MEGRIRSGCGLFRHSLWSVSLLCCMAAIWLRVDGGPVLAVDEYRASGVKKVSELSPCRRGCTR
jgi:hypothetical protein